MNRRNFYLFVWLCIVGVTTHSWAQSITTTTLSTTSLCPTGGAVIVTYTITGTFSATNTFSAQLSDASGAFTSPTVIGSVTSASAGAISANVPARASGSYKIRVASSNSTNTGPAVNLTVKAKPATPGTTSVTYCVGQAASALVASASGTLNWYNASGTLLSAAPIPPTTSAAVLPYYVSQTVDGCESDRATLVVTVSGPPSPPVVSDVSFCQNGPSSQLTASGTSLKWYDASDNPLNGAPTPSTSAAGTQIYKVSQTAGICESAKATITVTIKSLPGQPAVSTPGAYCQGVTAQPLSATGTGLLWYGTSASGGTSNSSATVPSTTAAGSSIYYVSQTVNGCEGPRAGITVTVKASPGAPTVSAVEFCQGTTPPTLTATLATNATPNWYGTNATGGTPNSTAPTPANTTPGTTTYYVSQTLDGCEGPRSGLSVRVKALPAAPTVTPASFCQNGPSSQLVANGTSLKWYDASDNPLSAAPTPGTSAVGDQIYKVSQTVEGCEGSKATLTVTIKSLPGPPAVSTPGAYCQGVTAQPLSATGTGLLWYGTSASGGTSNSSATVPSTTAAGSSIYYVSQTVNGCEGPRASITVTVKPKPGQPVTSAIEYCQNAGAGALTATFVSNSTPSWYGTSATGGTASANAPTPPTNTAGTFVYYVSQSVDGCESDRAGLSVRIKPLPAVPTVTPTSFCNTSAASALTAQGSNLRWYDASDNFLSGGAPTPNTSAVGDQTYKVSQTVESCEGPKAELKVTIKGLPVAPGVTNLNYCLQTQDQPGQNVIPLLAFGTNLKWYNADGTFSTTAPTPSISTTGTQSYLVSQTYDGCEGSKSTLVVTVRTTAVPTVAKSLVTYCINDKAVPLEATAETGGSLRWINPYNNVLTEAPIPSTLNTSIQAGGDPFYVYQIGQNGCYSNRAVIKVLVNAQPTLSLVSPVTSVNIGQRVALQLKFTSTAPFNYSISGGLSGVSNKADTTISLLPRATTTYQVLNVSNSCGVGLPGSPAAVTITVRVPTVTTSTLTASTICAGTSLTVPFTTTGEFNQGNLFRIELVNIADTTRKVAVAATSTGSPVTAPLPLTIAGGQYYVRVKADNPEIAIIGSNSPTTLTVRAQPSATLTGTQNIYEGYPASLTFTLGGDSPWTIAYADSISSYSAVATSSPYVLEVRPGRNTRYQVTSVTNGCGSGPVSGSATITVLPLLGVEDDPLGPLVKTYPIPTTSTVTVELDLPLMRTQAILSLTDMSGKTVIQQSTKNQRNELDLTAQPNGLYLLRIQVGERQTVRKVLKQ